MSRILRFTTKAANLSPLVLNRSTNIGKCSHNYSTTYPISNRWFSTMGEELPSLMFHRWPNIYPCQRDPIFSSFLLRTPAFTPKPPIRLGAGRCLLDGPGECREGACGRHPSSLPYDSISFTAPKCSGDSSIANFFVNERLGMAIAIRIGRSCEINFANQVDEVYFVLLIFGFRSRSYSCGDKQNAVRKGGSKIYFSVYAT